MVGFLLKTKSTILENTDEDEVIMATEFSEIERLADDAYKAGYASEIKTLTNETPLATTSQP